MTTEQIRILVRMEPHWVWWGRDKFNVTGDGLADGWSRPGLFALLALWRAGLVRPARVRRSPNSSHFWALTPAGQAVRAELMGRSLRFDGDTVMAYDDAPDAHGMAS